MKYFKMIIAALCCTLVACVEDREFPVDGLFSESKVEVKSAGDHIELSSDIDKHAIAGKVTEKGFYFSRKYNNYRNSYTDKITLAPDDEFKCNIRNDLRKGLECNVVAYVKEYGHEFRSNTVTFTCNAESVAPEVSDVRYEYDDESKITGKIIITGKNFGNTSQISLSSNRNDLKGKVVFKLESCSETMATFSYICCNVTDIPLTLKTFSSSVKLPKDLIIDGPKLNIGKSDMIMGVPRAFSITIGNKKVTDAVCKINDKKLNVGTDYLNNNELAFIPVGNFGSQNLVFSFTYNSETVYFQPTEVKFVNGWKKIGTIESYLSHPIYAFGKIWYPGNSKVQVNAISLTDFKNKIYSTKKRGTFASDNYHDQFIVKDDGIYLSENSSVEPEKIRIMRYDTKSDIFEIYQDVNITKEGEDDYYAFHLLDIIGNEIYFKQEETNKVKTWNQSTKKQKSKGVFYAEWAYYNKQYIGTDGNAFYVVEKDGDSQSLYRYPISNLKKKETVDFRFDQITGNGIAISNGNHHILNGRIYQSGLMRSTNLSNLTDHTYYGLPYFEEFTDLILLPAEKAPYCYDVTTGDVYQYIGK